MNDHQPRVSQLMSTAAAQKATGVEMKEDQRRVSPVVRLVLGVGGLGSIGLCMLLGATAFALIFATPGFPFDEGTVAALSALFGFLGTGATSAAALSFVV